MLTIIAGKYRSRQLLSPPDGETTRPYLARVRESVFDMLRGWFEDASVVDLFAGVGTVGLEAISRGARHVVLVEQDRRVYQLLCENIERLGCRDRAVPVLGDALGLVWAPKVQTPVDLVFVDPPYQLMRETETRQRVLQQIERCRTLMADRCFVVLRSPQGPDEEDLAVAGFDGPEPHRYRRDQWVLLYQPAAVTEAGSAGHALPTTGGPGQD
jgi:16S rRNA (guanine966-N2)-methyltransferase